jgi:hypothetical protein
MPACRLRSLRMHHWCLLPVLLLIVLTRPVQAQTLNQLRSEVRVKDPEPPSRPSNYDHHDDHHDHHHGDDDYDDGYSLEDIGLLGLLGGAVVTAPFWLPMSLADDNLGRPGYFPAHPYQYDVGYMLIHPNEYSGISGPRLPFTYAVRARSDYGTNFSGLDWVGGHVLAEFSTRFGAESDFRFYQQDILSSNSNQPQRDTAWLGDANVFFRFAQNDYVQMRSGVGINWLSDQQHTDVGFNFTYAGDFYLTKPWVISAEFDWGLLGDETLLHTRLTTGLTYRGLEAFVGHDFIDIGKFQSNSLIAGLRVWF